MSAIEAIIYCLGYVSPVAVDGEFVSQSVFDCLKNPHWISWRVAHSNAATPKFCSESSQPFAVSGEPYAM